MIGGFVPVIVAFVAVSASIPISEKYFGREGTNLAAFFGTIGYIAFFAISVGLGMTTVLFLAGGCLGIYSVWGKITDTPMKEETRSHLDRAIMFIGLYVIWSYWVVLFFIPIFTHGIITIIEVSMWSIVLVVLLALIAIPLTYRIIVGIVSLGRNAVKWTYNWVKTR